nr:hypothetical protein [Tanacetum cinerariifolium]
PKTVYVGNQLTKEGCFSHLSDILSEQDSPTRSFEDDSVSSSCVQVDVRHSYSRVVARQGSPCSVLGTHFREDKSSSFEYCETVKTDLHCY